jgi:hypothetical protein
MKEVRIYAQKFIDRGKDFNLELAIRTKIITDGLRYSLATGNWGDQKKALQARAGVSLVGEKSMWCESQHGGGVSEYGSRLFFRFHQISVSSQISVWIFCSQIESLQLYQRENCGKMKNASSPFLCDITVFQN